MQSHKAKATGRSTYISVSISYQFFTRRSRPTAKAPNIILYFNQQKAAIFAWFCWLDAQFEELQEQQRLMGDFDQFRVLLEQFNLDGIFKIRFSNASRLKINPQSPKNTESSLNMSNEDPRQRNLTK